MSKPAYPITDNLRKDLDDVIDETDIHVRIKAINLKNEMVSYMREYEHGSGDAEDLGISLTKMSGVLFDFFLYSISK